MTKTDDSTTPGASLVPLNTFAIARQDGSVEQVMRENIGQGGMTVFDLDRVRVPAGGGRSWIIPTLEGEDEAKTLDGVIVAWRDPRAFWTVSFDESGGGTPPDCSSEDGVLGRGVYGVGSPDHPDGRCATCPMSQWGSAVDGKGEPRRGQACKQMRLLFLLRESDLLPLALFMPPTSIGPLRKYFLRLSNASLPYYSVVTRLGLAKSSNRDGIEFSMVEPTLVGRLSADDVTKVKAYSDGLQDTLGAVVLTAEDVTGTDAARDDVGDGSG